MASPRFPFAQFVGIPGTDEPFFLPNPKGSAQWCSGLFDLAFLDRDRHAVLMFKVKAQGRAELRVVLSWEDPDEIKKHEIKQVFGPSESWESFHEFVPGEFLAPGKINKLCVERVTGQAWVSDIILLYHAVMKTSPW